MYPGAVPRTATIRSSVEAVASAPMRLHGHHRQRLARVLVDDVDQLQDPPVCGLVELGI